LLLDLRNLHKPTGPSESLRGNGSIHGHEIGFGREEFTAERKGLNGNGIVGQAQNRLALTINKGENMTVDKKFSMQRLKKVRLTRKPRSWCSSLSASPLSRGWRQPIHTRASAAQSGNHEVGLRHSQWRPRCAPSPKR
jgi:hypothetical protein